MNTPDDFRFAKFMIDFYKSDIYVDINGKLYIKYRNNLFNSKGHIGLFDDYKPNLYILTKDKINKMIEYVNSLGSYDDRMIINILDGFDINISNELNIIFKLTNTTFIKNLSGNKVNLVNYNNEHKILLIFDEFIVENSSFDVVENLYITLSKLELTPYVITHGRYKIRGVEFLYMLTDYVPLTIADVKDLKLKNNLLKRVLIIIYALRGMGYYNLDMHDENFLYDNLSKKVKKLLTIRYML